MADINLSINDSIAIVENVAVVKQEDFDVFLRSYPFVETTQTKVEIVEFESGVEQRLDTWGRNKKRFDINFPVMKKADVLAVQEFFEDRVGPANSFLFTNPVTEIKYVVRYVENSFNYRREHYDTYFASVSLIEVFS